jgi:Fe-S-cluster-containing hydrogenase component 2
VHECTAGRACLTACPKGMFEIITDDYDDEVAAVKQSFRRSLAFDCTDCKPAGGYSQPAVHDSLHAGGHQAFLVRTPGW